MVYRRNSSKQIAKTDNTENNRKNQVKELTKSQQREVEQVLKRDLLFLQELNSKQKFSVDWFNTVIQDIMFKCMGLKKVPFTFFGQTGVTNVFDPRNALESAKLLGKINGVEISPDIYIQDGAKVQNNFFHVELKPNAEKTANVIEILTEAGKFIEG